MKTYPEGTKWTVKLPAGAFPDKKYPDTDQSEPGQPRYEDVCRYGALACLNHWRARSATPDAIVLVRIPPPRPKRSVEERLAIRGEIVADKWIVAAHREGYERCVNENAAIHEDATRVAVDAAVRERTEMIRIAWVSGNYPVSFSEYLRDLRDGKVSA